ncbi:hypothetical protein SAMN05421780_10199 [Flexibacter flexilis DSM 6793]|uniref:DUF6892 domain-containing protein n=1 Tax=Flexibacter flexilis DSM 6793 TaxID=927664 RepID=A0A1I1DI56_9BACT|nr:hypothetical protein [Flexibacter flexilis]SFB72203.1 hypothetical protein SAMN05421780_10199 [Flexibacter flexilis DSM 6793]
MSIIQFKDRNFKLAVIQELMYNKKLLSPEFDIWESANNFFDRKIDINQEGYEIIPEVLEYYLNIEITEELAKNITKIYQNGGDDVYMNIIPYWDGEDDEFNIKSAEDAKYFPNMKNAVVFYDNDDSILDAFRKQGIDAKWL